MRHHTHYLRHITDWFEWLKNPKFGTPPDYSEFENDGTLRFHGDATVWDDLRFEASRQRASGSPAYTNYKGGQVLTLSSNVSQGIYFNAQTTHSRKLYSTMSAHFHYVLTTSGSGGGAENLKMDLTYSWAPANEGADSAFATETTISSTTDLQNQIADRHYIASIGNLTGPTTENVSDMLICSLSRDTTVANDYAHSIHLLEVDFHFEIDTLGSRETFVK